MNATGSDGRNFVRRHWRAVAAFVIAGALAFAGAVYIFLWFVSNAQSSGLVPGTLSLWTMGNLINFILYAIFYELLLVGIPVAVGAVIGWLWWRRLPSDERAGYHFGRGSRSSRGSGGVSFLFFVAFAIKVYLDGKWSVPIATFTLDYVVGSMVTILEWGVVILGIPGLIALVWWLSKRR